MKTIAAAIALMMIFVMTPARAYVVRAVIVEGQSNATGPENPSYVQIPQDLLVRFYPDYGAHDDDAADMSIGEVPSTSEPALPRWLQPLDMTPYPLQPIAKTGQQVGSSAGEIALGRALVNNYPTVHWGIIKFAYGASSLNRHWFNSTSMDFADRLILHISRVQQELASEGHTLRIVGVIHVQGGGDTLTDEPNDQAAYLGNLRKLAAKIRGYLADPRIPFIVSRIHFDFSKLTQTQINQRLGYDDIRTAQVAFVNTDVCSRMINEDTIPKNDGGFHFTQPAGFNTHGVRAFNALVDAWGTTGCQAPPAERVRR